MNLSAKNGSRAGVPKSVIAEVSPTGRVVGPEPAGAIRHGIVSALRLRGQGATDQSACGEADAHTDPRSAPVITAATVVTISAPRAVAAKTAVTTEPTVAAPELHLGEQIITCGKTKRSR